jgi:hypothetical protein
MAKKKIRKANPEYVLPERSGLAPETKRVLAIDPGSRNSGISVVAVNAKEQIKVMANSILTNPIHDLTIFGTQRDIFMQEIARWVDVYEPSGIIIERFQTRGLLGPLIEQVSIMIGIIAGAYPHIPIKLVTAATWKNEFHRRNETVTLDDLYKECRTTPHQLDSAFMGVFALEKGLRTTFDYDPIRIMRSAEASSRVRLINRKNRS